MHGIQESRIRVTANAGVDIGRNVGRIHGSERQYESAPTGKWHAVLSRMADDAVRRARQVFASLDEACRFQFSGNASWILFVIARERDALAAGKIGGARTKDEITRYDERHRDDGREGPKDGMRGSPALSLRVHSNDLPKIALQAAPVFGNW